LSLVVVVRVRPFAILVTVTEASLITAWFLSLTVPLIALLAVTCENTCPHISKNKTKKKKSLPAILLELIEPALKFLTILMEALLFFNVRWQDQLKAIRVGLSYERMP